MLADTPAAAQQQSTAPRASGGHQGLGSRPPQKMASSPSCASTWHGRESKAILVWTEHNRVWAECMAACQPPAAAVACKPQRRASTQHCPGGQATDNQHSLEPSLCTTHHNNPAYLHHCCGNLACLGRLCSRGRSLQAEDGVCQQPRNAVQVLSKQPHCSNTVTRRMPTPERRSAGKLGSAVCKQAHLLLLSQSQLVLKPSKSISEAEDKGIAEGQ